MIEPRRLAAEVPFANHAGVITGGAKMLCNVRLCAIESIENGDAIFMTVLSGEDRRTTGRADRVLDKAISEKHSLTRKAIEIRRDIDLATIGADRVGSVIIRHDEYDVRPLLSGGYEVN